MCYKRTTCAAIIHITTLISTELADLALSRVKLYKCAKCGNEYTDDTVPANDGCGGRIDIEFDLESLKESISRESLRKRGGGLWKYFELMPLRERENIVTLGEGGTPLLPARRLGEEMGFRNLFIKIETVNPSGSFKDRPICVGISRALEDGVGTVSAASSGNAAASMSTYAAKSGLRAVVFVPEDAPAAKLIHLRTLGAHVFRVKKVQEGIDPTTTLLESACKEFGWTPSPSFGPFNCFQFEGTKSMGYEIAEQMNWDPPDWVLYPTGSGGLMAGSSKGFKEFQEMGLIERVPRPVIVQPNGCAPIVRAFKEEQDPLDIKPWDSNETVAGGLADPFPWDGDAALNYLNKANGEAISVSDESIERYLLLLGKLEGVFAEPSGVAALAGLEHLAQDGIIDKQDRIVVPITGSGFKDLATSDRLTPQVQVIIPDTTELSRALAGRV
ncbi:MAG: threonine synthase [Candidatus Thorarchaeota archaeon]|nr:MAG: threonine synthase [Candidatus Thorarchaeota archaeon]